MAIIQKIESSLSPVFSKLPNLPKGTRVSLNNVLPLLAIIGSVMQFIVVLRTYIWSVDNISGVGMALTVDLSFWIYLLSTFMVGVLLFASYAKLKKSDKYGWDLLFIIPLLNVAAGLVLLIIDREYSLANLISSALVSALGLYFLFQVKEFYVLNGKKDGFDKGAVKSGARLYGMAKAVKKKKQK